MVKEKEVNYKLQRIKKDGYWDQYLVTTDKGYYWADDYESADLFSSIELLKSTVNKYKVDFVDKYNYYILEDIVLETIPYTGGEHV